MKITGVSFLAAAFVLIGVSGGQEARAQGTVSPEENGTGGYQQEPLDARPEPPRPDISEPGHPGIIRQAGIGGDIAFARAGVVELGGSLGLTISSQLFQFGLSPSVGYFIADNLELSVLSNVTFSRVEEGATTQQPARTVSKRFASLLLEPSYNLPFTDYVFGFVGLGIGATYSEIVDFGFAIAPRVGAKLLVGRSGILTASFSFLYSTNGLAGGAGVAPGNVETKATALTVSGAANINVGYTVMW